jgi:ABC-2 type transport system ATP-binding protein
MIETFGLGRRFGAVHAVRDVSLRVPNGSAMGLLGHNGAGKSTFVHLLTTLVRPTSGTAKVAGYDVVRQGHEVRRRIGLTGQFASLDEHLSGLENLVLVARLLGMDRRGARRRAAELLELFQLAGDGNRPVGQYSGGMKRRLDVAASLVGQPEVIFLDEPTTGLDPVSRTEAWHIIRELTRNGTTILLTTQDLEEADRLADRITVLADGRVVASGTPGELKRRAGRRTVRVTPLDLPSVPVVLDALVAAGLRPSVDALRSTVIAPARGGEDLMRAVRALDHRRIEVSAITLSEPTLHDVYLAVATVGGPADRADQQPARGRPTEAGPARGRPTETGPNGRRPTEAVPARGRPTEAGPNGRRPTEAGPNGRRPERPRTASPPAAKAAGQRVPIRPEQRGARW